MTLLYANHTLRCLRGSARPFHEVRRLYGSARCMEDYSFSNHRVLVTGGSRGIGKAIAHAFASHGAKCVLIGRNIDSLRQTTKELIDSYPENSPTNADNGESTSHTYFAMDVGDKSSWESLVAQKNKAFHSLSPRIDILVNAAGITSTSLFMKTETQLQEDIVQTNLMGTIWASRYIGKEILKNKRRPMGPINRGVIINISSLLGSHGGRGAAVYTASKAGITGLSRALASELGYFGVRVNTIVPGYIDTDMLSFLEDKSNNSLLQKIPLQRFGTAEEIAHAALFLARNAYANNCTINLDGGLSSE